MKTIVSCRLPLNTNKPCWRFVLCLPSESAHRVLNCVLCLPLPTKRRSQFVPSHRIPVAAWCGLSSQQILYLIFDNSNSKCCFPFKRYPVVPIIGFLTRGEWKVVLWSCSFYTVILCLPFWPMTQTWVLLSSIDILKQGKINGKITTPYRQANRISSARKHILTGKCNVEVFQPFPGMPVKK